MWRKKKVNKFIIYYSALVAFMFSLNIIIRGINRTPSHTEKITPKHTHAHT